MGKYEPLARFLEQLPEDSWDARFLDIEHVLGFKLPKSAHQYQAWWANQESGHSQTLGWQAVGFETNNLDLQGKRVRFVRANQKTNVRQLRKEDKAPEIDELWRRASELSGITNRTELERAAAQAFINRTAAQQLIELGGTMPDAEAPPRRRFL